MYDQSRLSELIRFARVNAGSTVIDVYPGDGDWTRLFSDVVGPEGRVYSFVPAEVAHFKNDPVGRMQTLAKEPGRENVEAVSADLVAMPEATQPADVLWLHLFYHDLHTELIQARGATAAQFNRAVYERLKPGGWRKAVVDHRTLDPAGSSWLDLAQTSPWSTGARVQVFQSVRRRRVHDVCTQRSRKNQPQPTSTS